MEDAHRRARTGKGLSALAWRRGRQTSGLRQPGAAEIRGRARDDAPARRFGRAFLRPYPRSRRHAARLAARFQKIAKDSQLATRTANFENILAIVLITK